MLTPTITTLNIGYLRADLSEMYGLPADHPSAGQVDELPMFCYHIALATRSVLVDAPAYEFTDAFADLAIPGRHAPPLLDQLAGANIDATDATDVIITHAHFDHYNGLTCFVDGRYVPAFPNARHYLGAGDWQPENFGQLEERTLQVVYQAGLLTLVDAPRDLGDGLLILPAPGESPGHQVLHLRAGGIEAYFSGDLCHHPLEFAEPAWNVMWATADVMRASKAALIKRAAGSGALVFFAHIPGPCRVEWPGHTAGDSEGSFEWNAPAS